VVVTHTAGFRHDSIRVAETIIAQLARTSGAFDVSFCRTAEDVRRMLTPAALADVAAVVFANTTGNVGVPDLDAFLGWIAAGRGFAGVHSASDTYHDAPAYLEMLGNEFATHGNQVDVNAVVENGAHPAVAHLGGVTPLLTLDRYPADGLEHAGEPGDLPLAWARSYGAGRVFYTALGHREELWRDQRFQQHILGGIRAVLVP
jgi:type 1 glutamine amidotransferase